MIALSARLGLIASMVPQNAAVCDVGCDHGYLALSLLESGRARSVIAADLREKPLASARANAARFGLEQISFRLCDGLSGVKPGEADTVIIAGMGGDVISGILSRCAWIRDSAVTLLLQAMTSAEVLRDYLAENGFRITAEPALFENRRVYSIISARYDGICRPASPVYRYIGAVSPETEAGKAYLLKQYRRLSACAEKLCTVAHKQEEYLEYKTAAEALGRLLEG